MAGQKQMAAKMADEYVLKIPSVTFPEDSPQWVTTVFPALIKSIYETFNGMVKKMVSDFNDSYSDLQKQIEDLSKLNTTANATVTELQSQLSERDHIINDQSSSINKLQMSVEKSESYSRRSNLIFGGIPKDAQGSCSSIVHNIMGSKMDIADTEAVKFVRCHYLNQPTNDRKGSIIARFENILWSRVSNMVRHRFLVTIVQRPLSYIQAIHMRSNILGNRYPDLMLLVGIKEETN